MLTPRLVSRFPQTRDLLLLRYSATLTWRRKFHGTFPISPFYKPKFQFKLFSTICIRYGLEQEYTLLQKSVNWPLGWPLGGFPGPQVINLKSRHQV